jgi:hypothetical protein
VKEKVLRRSRLTLRTLEIHRSRNLCRQKVRQWIAVQAEAVFQFLALIANQPRKQ